MGLLLSQPNQASIAGGDQLKQAVKSFVQFASAQGSHALRAVHFGANHSCGAEHLEMMRPGRLRYIEPNFVAGQRAAFGSQQFTDDGQPARVGQRVHDCGQFNFAHRWMAVSLHNTAPCHHW